MRSQTKTKKKETKKNTAPTAPNGVRPGELSHHTATKATALCRSASLNSAACFFRLVVVCFFFCPSAHAMLKVQLLHTELVSTQQSSVQRAAVVTRFELTPAAQPPPLFKLSSTTSRRNSPATSKTASTTWYTPARCKTVPFQRALFVVAPAHPATTASAKRKEASNNPSDTVPASPAGKKAKKEKKSRRQATSSDH